MSAGAVVFKLAGSQPVFCLMLDRYGHWTCPKGHVKAGESPGQAALRELREEVGLRDPAVLGRLGLRRYRFTRGGQRVSKKVHWFLVRAPARARLSASPAEGVCDACWLPAEEAIERCGYRGMRSILRQAVARAGAACRHTELA